MDIVDVDSAFGGWRVSSEIDGGEIGAGAESKGTDLGDGSGDCDAGKSEAVPKGEGSDLLKGIREGNGFKREAIGKGVIGDIGHTLGNVYGF